MKKAAMLFCAGLIMAGFAAGRPMDIRSPNLEPSRGGKPRTPVMVPQDATNLLSGGCAVTSGSVPLFSGELSCLTDGEKEHDDRHVDLPDGPQWVQIDLGRTQEIWAVCIWHWYEYACVYRDVICQVSNDPDFIDGVVTLFNNDCDNSAKQGVGSDKEYIESFEGRLFSVAAIKARYLRFYSNGNTESKSNRFTEIEVYGREPVTHPPVDEPRVRLRIQLPKPIFS